MFPSPWVRCLRIQPHWGRQIYGESCAKVPKQFKTSFSEVSDILFKKSCVNCYFFQVCFLEFLYAIMYKWSCWKFFPKVRGWPNMWVNLVKLKSIHDAKRWEQLWFQIVRYLQQVKFHSFYRKRSNIFYAFYLPSNILSTI